MTVCAIVQLKMIDCVAYDRYQARFFDVFKKTADGFSEAGSDSSDPRLPPRPEPEAEEERHRRLIRVRPIIIRSVVVRSAVIAMVGIMPVVPDATPRTEVGCLRCVSCAQAYCVQACCM
jgi:hypothetical protein